MISPASVESWRASPLPFFEDVLVMADGRSYGASLDPWQREDFERAAEGRNTWWERPRGHSKTTDAAALALHHLLVTPGARVYFGASDRDQGALVFDSLISFVRRSPLLQGAFTIAKWELVAPSTDARLVVMASDAPSSWGLRPSLVVIDELQAWRGAGAEEFFYALYSSLGKVRGARLLVATTAGWDEQSLCYELRQRVMEDQGWQFSRRGQCASWISPEFLEERAREQYGSTPG